MSDFFNAQSCKTRTNSNRRENDSHTQLGLFPGNVSPQSPKPLKDRPTNPPRSKPREKPKLSIAPILRVSIVPIPQSEFEGDRYCLRYGSFRLQFELPKPQAYELLARTFRLDWTLDDRGFPIEIDQIWAAAQRTIDGGVA